MQIAIAGGTGFVGSALTAYLIEKGHYIYILTRNPNKVTNNNKVTYVKWLSPESKPEIELENIDAFINLAGESINSGRWTKERKHRIKSSRIQASKEVNRIISKLTHKPSVLIQASAIGIYGTSLDKPFTERTEYIGADFLADTVHAWENEGNKASELGIRVALMRFGIILGKTEGALPKMILPYQLFIGGTVGSGNQWLSWVHIHDLVRSIEFTLSSSISGPINVTAPNPMKMKEFGQTIGKVINRPHWLPVPDYALKILLGEMSMLIVEGQKVIPEKLKNNGFNFIYKNLVDAIENIVKSE
jgi:uncharacterized protein